MTLLIYHPEYSPFSAGIRVLHYLAAMLRAADIDVGANVSNHYNPDIPARSIALPDDVVVYPDLIRGNPMQAKRICRYFLYYTVPYFDPDRILKDEACIVYHRDYFDDVAAHCDHPMTDGDIIQVPNIEGEWCFPETKTTENLYYPGKCAVPFQKMPPGEYSTVVTPPDRMQSLARLRRAKNFYTSDQCSAMADEAHLCGCNVYQLNDAGEYELSANGSRKVRGVVMNPKEDVGIARRFAERVYGFFKCTTTDQPSTTSQLFPQIRASSVRLHPRSQRPSGVE